MEQFVWAGWTVTAEWNQLKGKYNSFYIDFVIADASLSLQMQFVAPFIKLHAIQIPLMFKLK